MSRIGKKPIEIPDDVSVILGDGTVTVKGPKGTLTRPVDTVKLEVKDGHAYVTCPDNADKSVQAKHGLYRSLINNMVVGVKTGFTRSLIINGVGYKANVTGNKLVMNIGFSHQVEMTAPDGITFGCPTQTEITVSGCDKELVGQTAANIKSKRPVEPYHAYGVRYKEEQVIIKEGKKAGK